MCEQHINVHCIFVQLVMCSKHVFLAAALVPFTAATLVVLVCPLSLVWLKLAARYKKPSNAVSKQSRPLPLDGGSRGPPNCKQKSRTAVLVLCSSEKHSYPRCKVIKTVVRVLVILWVLYLLLLLAGDVERNPGPTSKNNTVIKFSECYHFSPPPPLPLQL